MNDDELSVPEVQGRLNVTHTTVKQMIKRGELTVVREEYHGRQRRVYVRASDVEAIVAQRRGAASM